MPKQIVVTITPENEISVETKGYKGKNCVADSEFIKKALGEAGSVKYTPEYYMTEDRNVIMN